MQQLQEQLTEARTDNADLLRRMQEWHVSSSNGAGVESNQVASSSQATAGEGGVQGSTQEVCLCARLFVFACRRCCLIAITHKHTCQHAYTHTYTHQPSKVHGTPHAFPQLQAHLHASEASHALVLQELEATTAKLKEERALWAVEQVRVLWLVCGVFLFVCQCCCVFVLVAALCLSMAIE